jgi:hypothetical protein
MNISMSLEEYEALSSLARKGRTADELRAVDSFLKSLDAKNSIVRYEVWVQWQETDSPLPPTANFPTVWPPELRAHMERFDRPIAKTDVEALLLKKARAPMSILVTKDPAGVLGWTEIDQFFLT